MKKISLIALLLITIIYCLCSCGNSSSQSTNNKPSTSNKTTASDISESGSFILKNGIAVVSNELFFAISDKYLFNIIY